VVSRSLCQPPHRTAVACTAGVVETVDIATLGVAGTLSEQWGYCHAGSSPATRTIAFVDSTHA
jgi:hypothetical protein